MLFAGVIPRPGSHFFGGSAGSVVVERDASPLRRGLCEPVGVSTAGTFFPNDDLGGTFSADESRKDTDCVGVGATNEPTLNVSSRSELSKVRSPRIDDETSSRTSPANGLGGLIFVRSVIFSRGDTLAAIASDFKAC